MRGSRGLILAAVAVGLSGCAWWNDMTGQSAMNTPPAGAANFNSMMAAIANPAQETQAVSKLGAVNPDNVIVANANMMARGDSGRLLDEAMRRNAPGITALRKQIGQTPALAQVLAQRGVPINNVLAVDTPASGGAVVYTLPTVQTGQAPADTSQ